MNDVDRLTEEAIRTKVGQIATELNRALNSYADLTRKSLEQGNNVDPETESDLLEAMAYIGMAFSGLAVLFAMEANQQVKHLRDNGITESQLQTRTSSAKIQSLKFIEDLVKSVNGKVKEALGLPTNLPLPKPPTDGSLN